MKSSQFNLTRREMLAATAAAASAAVGWQSLEAQGPAAEEGKMDIWDAHCHLNGRGGTPRERMKALVSVADRMGIDRLVVFMGYPLAQDPTPDDVRRQNDQVLDAIGHSGGRALGFVYLNPKHTEASLKELDRCVRDGPMVGIKLWVAVRCNQPCLDPIVQRAIELKAPVLQHTWYKVSGNMPGESTPADLAELALRHPNASFVASHVGGDWERGVRAIRIAKNACAETCGSDPTAGMVEMAVRELGAERVIYGSDVTGRSYASQLAKVHGAEVPHEAKRLIFAGNVRRLLGPILSEKGVAS